MARADHAGMNLEYEYLVEEIEEKARMHLNEILNEGPKVDSPLNGEELMNLGIKEGPKISLVKNFLKGLVIDGELASSDKEKAYLLVKKCFLEF